MLTLMFKIQTKNMKTKILSFYDFATVNEADKEAKGKEGDKKKEPVELPKEEKVDAKDGQYKNMEIDGKEYRAILSTYTAIGSKQEAMGKSKVGIISLPGDEKIYELITKEGDGGEEKKNESNESEVNEEYVEVMNLPELSNTIGKIAELWKEWKNGPMTEPSDIKPAQKELKGWIDRWFKDNIK